MKILNRSRLGFPNLFSQENILVSPVGEALVADYHLALALDAASFTLGSTTTVPASGSHLRYAAPEQLDELPWWDGRRYHLISFESDVYAFGLLIFEVRSLP